MVAAESVLHACRRLASWILAWTACDSDCDDTIYRLKLSTIDGWCKRANESHRPESAFLWLVTDPIEVYLVFIIYIFVEVWFGISKNFTRFIRSFGDFLLYFSDLEVYDLWYIVFFRFFLLSYFHNSYKFYFALWEKGKKTSILATFHFLKAKKCLPSIEILSSYPIQIR